VDLDVDVLEVDPRERDGPDVGDGPDAATPSAEGLSIAIV
jgi:hypothetical protein